MPEEPDKSQLVEETRVTSINGFPPHVRFEILTADGKLHVFQIGPMMAHKVSDDLLLGVAAVKRSEHLAEGR